MNIPTIKQSRNGTFADLLVRYVRDRRDGDAPSVYTAAWLDRRTWSAIVSNPMRPVAKRTAVQFALALRLTLPEAQSLLSRAGYTLSHSYLSDILVEYCIRQKQYDVLAVNELLFSYDQPLLGS